MNLLLIYQLIAILHFLNYNLPKFNYQNPSHHLTSSLYYLGPLHIPHSISHSSIWIHSNDPWTGQSLPPSTPRSPRPSSNSTLKSAFSHLHTYRCGHCSWGQTPSKIWPPRTSNYRNRSSLADRSYIRDTAKCWSCRDHNHRERASLMVPCRSRSDPLPCNK